MKYLHKILVIASVVLNLYYMGQWTVAFNKFDNQPERVSAFTGAFPINLSSDAINMVLIVLTLLSVFLVLKNGIENKTYRLLFMVFQGFFMLFQFWQYL